MGLYSGIVLRFDNYDCLTYVSGYPSSVCYLQLSYLEDVRLQLGRKFSVGSLFLKANIPFDRVLCQNISSLAKLYVSETKFASVVKQECF